MKRSRWDCWGGSPQAGLHPTRRHTTGLLLQELSCFQRLPLEKEFDLLGEGLEENLCASSLLGHSTGPSLSSCPRTPPTPTARPNSRCPRPQCGCCSGLLPVSLWCSLLQGKAAASAGWTWMTPRLWAHSLHTHAHTRVCTRTCTCTRAQAHPMPHGQVRQEVTFEERSSDLGALTAGWKEGPGTRAQGL